MSKYSVTPLSEGDKVKGIFFGQVPEPAPVSKITKNTILVRGPNGQGWKSYQLGKGETNGLRTMRPADHVPDSLLFLDNAQPYNIRGARSRSDADKEYHLNRSRIAADISDFTYIHFAPIKQNTYPTVITGKKVKIVKEGKQANLPFIGGTEIYDKTNKKHAEYFRQLEWESPWWAAYEEDSVTAYAKGPPIHASGRVPRDMTEINGLPPGTTVVVVNPADITSWRIHDKIEWRSLAPGKRVIARIFVGGYNNLLQTYDIYSNINNWAGKNVNVFIKYNHGQRGQPGTASYSHVGYGTQVTDPGVITDKHYKVINEEGDVIFDPLLDENKVVLDDVKWNTEGKHNAWKIKTLPICAINDPRIGRKPSECYQILGCMSSGARNYDPRASLAGDCMWFHGCMNNKASNYNPVATKDDGTCIIPGCTNDKADNYDPIANKDDGTCIIPGCTNDKADNYDPIANKNDGTCIIPGCTNDKADNYDPVATKDDGTCIIPGCTNDKADNYDPVATKDDGTCIIPGCTNDKADNYDSNANEDDGTCIIPGCTNDKADNYDSNANEDDGSCIIPGCTNDKADNYDSNANEDDGSCIMPDVVENKTFFEQHLIKLLAFALILILILVVYIFISANK